jgi:neutral ceramidase
MQVGFHTTDITPTFGMEKPGGYSKVFIDAIHDPLKVRAAVIEEAGSAVALVGVDTCQIGSQTLLNHVCEQIERRVGIPRSHIVIGASHTHSGGPLWETGFEDLSDAPDLVRTLFYEHSVNGNRLYSEYVGEQIITAVCEAARRREDAELSIGSGYEDQVAHNRRFHMRNGRVYTHPGKGNPDILEAAGPTDPEVGVISAWSTDGEWLGCIVNYACHCTVHGSTVSADYVYDMERTIQGAMRSDAPVVFLQGASGDVTQVDNLALTEPQFGERWRRYVGTRVGAEALKVMVTAERGSHTPVVAATSDIRLRRRRPNPESIARSREVVDEGLRSGRFTTDWTFAKERILVDYICEREPEFTTTLQALQIGETVILANSAELFCELGLEMKQESPFARTFVVELANGCIGYVAPEHAFEPQEGGYETVLTSYSTAEVGAGAKLTRASIELAETLTPGEEPTAVVPQDEDAAEVEAWSYGVLGPDVD